MGERWSLVAACRSVGLDCRCEHRPGEPRFRLGIDHGRTDPLLYLTLRNDDGLHPHPIAADPETPGVLFGLVERTVVADRDRRAWLPCTREHVFVVWRDLESWRVVNLKGGKRVATVAEAVECVRTGQRTGG